MTRRSLSSAENACTQAAPAGPEARGGQEGAAKGPCGEQARERRLRGAGAFEHRRRFTHEQPSWREARLERRCGREARVASERGRVQLEKVKSRLGNGPQRLLYIAA